MQMAFSPTQPMLTFGRSPILPMIPLSPPSYCAHPIVLMSPRPSCAHPSAVTQPRPSHSPAGRESPEQKTSSQRCAVGLRPPARDDQAQDIKVDKNFHFFLDLDGIVPGYDVHASADTCICMHLHARGAGAVAAIISLSSFFFGPDRLHCTGG